MQLLHGDEYFGETELGLIFCELLLAEVVKELASWVELEEEVEMVFAFEGGLQFGGQRDVADHFAQYFFLTQNSLECFELLEVFFLDLLQGEQFATCCVSDQKNAG